jgi:hypothetical protein
MNIKHKSPKKTGRPFFADLLFIKLLIIALSGIQTKLSYRRNCLGKQMGFMGAGKK